MSDPQAGRRRTSLPLVLVVAAGDNNVIGAGGGLPWRLKSDLAHFKKVTSGHPVVMGRKTYAAIGRTLPGRTNIVLTRDRTFAAPGIAVADNLAGALAVADGDARRRGVDAVMIIGGAEIYRLVWPIAARIELTRVHCRPQGDAVFPVILPAEWRELARSEHPAGPHDDAPFTILSYERQ